MFSKLFGDYLLEKGYISKVQFENVNEKVNSIRVKMGLIAVAEGMMTEAQADNVNRIQAMEDKRFGDIAVEKGYLTEQQVSELLKKQGNSYIQFIQALVDEEIYSLDDINAYLNEYKDEYGYTNLDMEMLKSGDTNKEISVLVRTGDEYADKHLSLVVKSVIRLIDAKAVVLSTSKVSDISYECFGYQKLAGDFDAFLGFGAEQKAIITVANLFAKEEYTTVDADTYDAVCEFTNCVNGLFASELSNNEVDLDMLPPMYKDNAKITADNMYVVELCVNNTVVKAVVANNCDINVE